jgi:phosphatidylglycerol:prolipoprotein diacylglycerol transferase
MLNTLYHSLNPIAFYIGTVPIHWYGLGYIVGIILGAIVVWKTARHWRLPFNLNRLLGLVIAGALGIIIGGRLGYVLFYNLPYYAANPGQIIATYNGGMSFHGGVIGVIIAVFIYARILKLPFLRVMDLVCVAAPIGICLVRCCNFINGELWGAPTNLPWGVDFGPAAGNIMRQPSQLYEALLEGVVLFIVLYALSRKYPPRLPGSFCGTFALLYGIFRFAVEFIRQPDAQIGYLFGTHWFTMGQLLSIPLMIAGAAILIATYEYHLHQRTKAAKAAKTAQTTQSTPLVQDTPQPQAKAKTTMGSAPATPDPAPSSPSSAPSSSSSAPSSPGLSGGSISNRQPDYPNKSGNDGVNCDVSAPGTPATPSASSASPLKS